ncbi:flavin reductase family protein [Ferrimonas senticii]|uniref:flavin reductase family protein n=1 Tax=Ferrimonas senticii TaxID=394566 RepID=UPI00041005BF|nr:iron-sulfur cluster-binding domain-containing protein [Ferrimonas senticii]
MHLTCTAVIDETSSIRSFRFRAEQPLEFIAGQFATVLVPLGDRTSARAYSFSSKPSDSELQLTIKRVDGGRVSNHLLDNFNVGDQLEVLPQAAGEFHRDSAGTAPWLLLGAGCGITPLYSMLRDRLSDEPEADIVMMVSAKTADEALFAAPLAELAAKHPNFQLKWLLSASGERLSQAAIAKFAAKMTQRSVMICGPQTYMDAAEAYAHALNAAKVQCEAFTQVKNQLADLPAAGKQSMHLAIDGIELPILPNQSVLDSLEAGGIPVLAACRAGVCGTCKCKGEKGKFETTSTIGLTEDEIEEGYFLACASTVTASMEVEIDD